MSSGEPVPKRGGFQLIVGPMFSGKTGLLLDVLDAAEHAPGHPVGIKLSVDTRHKECAIVSHDGRSRAATVVATVSALRDELGSGARVVGIDEAQFFGTDIVEAILDAVSNGTFVVATALDLDFRGEPFGTTSALVRVATVVSRLVGVCSRCGAPATHTQRFIGRKVAPLESPVVFVGGAESYQPRCATCFREERAALV